MDDVKTKKFTELLDELGIDECTNSDYSLILFNDDVNDITYVVDALYNVCCLNEQEAVTVMLEAHTTGKAVAKSGSLEDMRAMKKGLNEKFINAEVEENS